MSVTTLGDKLIHYEAVGRGEPVIFIHGWLGSWRYWWSSMQQLSTHYRCFAFDLWGFGDSTKAPDKYSFEEYVSMLDRFIERLGIAPPVTLVGHALGAAVALGYAAKKPAAVERLAAVALPVSGGDIDARLGESDPGAFLNRVLGRERFPEVESELRKTDQEALNRLAGELRGRDFATELDSVPMPVLLVFGGQDQVVQQPSGAYVHFQQPAEHRAYVSLQASNHFPMLEETAKFNRLILDFTRANSNLQELSPKEYWTRRTH